MRNKKILIIGGTGSLGKELIKKYQDSNEILVLSRDEQKQVLLKRDPKINKNVSYMIGDLKSKESLTRALLTYRPQIIINTAALKHIDVCEQNPIECVNVNVLGHITLLDVLQSTQHLVEQLIFISTDKACNPINIYGMCKAVTEKLYLDFANRIQASSRHPKLSVGIVRYGNVLNSAGSIIPFFLEKIRKGETELPITDERMTRFLISLPAAVELIDWTITNEIHAQIVVPKLKGFRVLDVASALTETPVTFKYIGIRAGEKLHEDLISDSEGFFTKDAGAYYLIGNKYQNSEVLGYRSDNCLSSKQDLIEMLKRENII